MADTLHSSAAPAPYRDSVDETSPLLSRDAEAGAASTGGPAEASARDTQNWRTSRRFDIGGAIIASRVLLITSVISLLLGGATLILYILEPSEHRLSWRIADMLRLLGFIAFLSVFLSAANLIILSRARARNETSPSPLGIFINVIAHVLLSLFLIVATINVLEEISWSASGKVGRFAVLLFIWIAGSVILGWIVLPALLIFWLRGLIIWISNTGSWSTWSLPGGQLTIEASIRFHRQEPPRDARESA